MATFLPSYCCKTLESLIFAWGCIAPPPSTLDLPETVF